MKQRLWVFMLTMLMCLSMAAAVSAADGSDNTLPFVPYDEQFYIYTVTDGCATIIGRNGELSGDITIPATLGGYPVTEIGEYAFFNCTNITSVIVPDSIVSIGEGSFLNCTSLTNITLPDTLSSIGKLAFDGCTNLISFPISSGITQIGARAFGFCRNITEFIVSEENTCYTTENGILFSKDKTALIAYPAGRTASEYIVPDHVVSIEDAAFSSNASLTTIRIPDNVRSIGEHVFYHCSALTDISVSSGNPNYVSKDGVLFTRDMTELIAYPIGKEESDYAIPSGVVSICGYAFGNCGNLTSVTVPYGVTSLGEAAFAVCDYLTGISLPSSVTSIGALAFYLCSDLTSAAIPNRNTAIMEDAFFECPNLTIYGHAGSTAEAYAESNNVPFAILEEILLPGDLNNDSMTDADDLRIFMQYFAGWKIGYDISSPEAADLNGDGKITRSDAMILARYLDGWPEFGDLFDAFTNN